MKTLCQITKNIILVVYLAAVTLDIVLVLGEDTGLMDFNSFIAIKMASLAAAYYLYRIGIYAYRHGFCPEWYRKIINTLKLKEE